MVLILVLIPDSNDLMASVPRADAGTSLTMQSGVLGALVPGLGRREGSHEAQSDGSAGLLEGLHEACWALGAGRLGLGPFILGIQNDGVNIRWSRLCSCGSVFRR